MMDETQAKDVLAEAPPQAKPGQLVDPPEVAKYAQRGDPPMSEWPGRIVGRKDLMMASGDPRDWFRYGHREQAYTEAWEEFADAHSRRQDLMANFSWNQILVLGTGVWLYARCLHALKGWSQNIASQFVSYTALAGARHLFERGRCSLVYGATLTVADLLEWPSPFQFTK